MNFINNKTLRTTWPVLATAEEEQLVHWMETVYRRILYKATITAPGVPTKYYIGIAATTFKARYSNHKSSLSNRNYSQSTTLSTYFWKLRDIGKNPSVSFSSIRVVPSYTPEYGKCRLCTAEKVEILNSDQSLFTNKRQEILSVCRHKKRFKLEDNG